MTEKQQKAIELHGKGYNCFQSVACVFAPELDVDEVTAFRMGEGFGLGARLAAPSPGQWPVWGC